jgi:hypothetical protein
MGLFAPREASGTAWLPDVTPMYGIQATSGAWQLMAHGNLFAQFLREGGERGRTQTGSINWAMGMARRSAGAGRVGLRAMFSLEPWTVRGCGYPDLLASGEVCDGEPIHDRQHPHDLIMELAAEYERPLGPVRLQAYGGLAGEPALGPVAYPHRFSALANPIVPIAHHWLDATHITYGVITGAVYGSKWKAEASMFNGREPDEDRVDFDLASLSSLSARLWYLPRPSTALQVSAGHLDDAEPAHQGSGRVDVNRVTASATYHRAIGRGDVWGSTMAWGRNSEEGEASNALLLETTVTFDDRDAWFGRFETGSKGAHDLDIHDSDGRFTVAKLQAGYVRYFRAWQGLTPGFGGSVSAGIVPRSLQLTYGSRVNGGFGLFFTLRPAGHLMIR